MCYIFGKYVHFTIEFFIYIKKRNDFWTSTLETLRNLESRLNLELERLLLVVSFTFFQLNRKKTEFRPDDENIQVTAISNVYFLYILIYIHKLLTLDINS